MVELLPPDRALTPDQRQKTVYTWESFFKILRGQLPPAEQRQYRHERDLQNEIADCKRCDDWKEYLFKYSKQNNPHFISISSINVNPTLSGPTIRFMRDNINLFDNDINPSNVRCRRCPPDGKASGGFNPDFGIRICANELRNRAHLEDTLAHEMVHAYDHLRWKVDWSGRDLRHAACAEIRASSLSGECRWAREFFTRGQWAFTQHHQECVRRRAVASVMQRPWCEDEAAAKKAVDSVWEGCFADTRPFDEIYR